MQLLLLSEQLNNAVVVLLVGHDSLDLQFVSKEILNLVDIGKVQMMRLELPRFYSWAGSLCGAGAAPFFSMI